MVKRRVQGPKEPPDMAHIRRVGLTYYARFTIPKDRWHDAGRREVVRTLQTRDLKEARKRIGPALEDIRRSLDRADWQRLRAAVRHLEALLGWPRPDRG